MLPPLGEIRYDSAGNKLPGVYEVSYKGHKMQRPDPWGLDGLPNVNWRSLASITPEDRDLIERLQLKEERQERERAHQLEMQRGTDRMLQYLHAQKDVDLVFAEYHSPFQKEKDVKPFTPTVIPMYTSEPMPTAQEYKEMEQLGWGGSWDDLMRLRAHKRREVNTVVPDKPEFYETAEQTKKRLRKEGQMTEKQAAAVKAYRDSQPSIPLERQELVDIVPHDVIGEVEDMANKLLNQANKATDILNKARTQIREWLEFCTELKWEGIWFEVPYDVWQAIANSQWYVPIARGQAFGRYMDSVIVAWGDVDKITPHSKADPLTFKPAPQSGLAPSEDKASELETAAIQTQRREDKSKRYTKEGIHWMGTWPAPNSGFPEGAAVGQAYIIEGNGPIRGFPFKHGDMVIRKEDGWTKFEADAPSTLMSQRAAYRQALKEFGVTDAQDGFDAPPQEAPQGQMERWARQSQIGGGGGSGVIQGGSAGGAGISRVIQGSSIGGAGGSGGSWPYRSAKSWE